MKNIDDQMRPGGLPMHLRCRLEALFLDFRFITGNLVIYSQFRELFYLSSLGHFKQKKIFFSKFVFTNSCSLFVDLLQKQKPVLDWDCSLKTGKKD